MFLVEKKSSLTMKLPEMNFVVRIMVLTILWFSAMAATVHGTYIIKVTL